MRHEISGQHTSLTGSRSLVGGSCVQAYAKLGGIRQTLPLSNETCNHSGQYIPHAPAGHAGVAIGTDSQGMTVTMDQGSGAF